MSKALLPLIAEVLALEPADIDDDSNNETVSGWDSGTEVELALMLEHEFSIALNKGEMSRLISVREVRAVLAAHGITDI